MRITRKQAKFLDRLGTMTSERILSLHSKLQRQHAKMRDKNVSLSGKKLVRQEAGAFRLWQLERITYCVLELRDGIENLFRNESDR